MTNLLTHQWKSYQPPVQDPAILAFQQSSPTPSNISASLNNILHQNPGQTTIQTSPAPINNSLRETGIIDKLQHSYGFIQCCEREARLFFHFSEFNGTMNEMKVGDNVEFQMASDRRTGKPIAVSVVKMAVGTASFEVINEKRVTGTIVVEAKQIKHKAGSVPNLLMQEGAGRVNYEECGEHFFIPYMVDDVLNGAKIRQGDKVSFQVATDKRNGSVHAVKLGLVQTSQTERHEGVICSLKEGYGFIERADMVKEIFFHYSEYQGDINEIVLGDDVEFAVQMRNGKEVAVDIKSLPEGTVIFEDVGVEKRRGRIINTLKAARGRKSSDPLAGRIVYETVKGSIEIPYGDKDQNGEYTLQVGDLVDFNIATDRRDKLQRATNICLVEDTFKISGEVRETGVITSVKDGFGFIRCADREARMFFHFSEMMTVKTEIQVNEEVEFTVVQDPSSPSRQIAIRIKYLPKGTISFETVLPTKLTGSVEKEPSVQKNAPKNKEPDPGIIMYDVNGTKQMIPYTLKDIQGNPPKTGDKVDFQICESRKNNTKTAVNVKSLVTVTRTTTTTNKKQASEEQKFKGFIATLKDSFGFIETSTHDKEVFFHFSNFEGDPTDLDLGDEVEYSLAKKTNKVSADYIRKLPKGSLSLEEIQPGLYEGKVVRSLRIINPDQDEYPGLVQLGHDDDATEFYSFGITSLTDKRDFLQKGDLVKFQIANVKGTNQKRAMNVAAVRKYIRAKVDSTIGKQYGFLNYEAEEGKKLFFHMTEVHNGADIQPGDEVEFVVVYNQRNKKYSATSLRKITDRQRPERLMSRLKSISEDLAGPKLITIRQPKGPDGSKGFQQPRQLRPLPNIA